MVFFRKVTLRNGFVIGPLVTYRQFAENQLLPSGSKKKDPTKSTFFPANGTGKGEKKRRKSSLKQLTASYFRFYQFMFSNHVVGQCQLIRSLSVQKMYISMLVTGQWNYRR